MSLIPPLPPVSFMPEKPMMPIPVCKGVPRTITREEWEREIVERLIRQIIAKDK